MNLQEATCTTSGFCGYAADPGRATGMKLHNFHIILVRMFVSTHTGMCFCLAKKIIPVVTTKMANCEVCLFMFSDSTMWFVIQS